MPLYPPRTLAPVKQLETLAKREARLVGILLRGGKAQPVSAAVEGVRTAHLAVLKARRALIEYKPDSEEKRAQLSSIARLETEWSQLLGKEILDRYEQRSAPNKSMEPTRER
jgi:hypothetical protein